VGYHKEGAGTFIRLDKITGLAVTSQESDQVQVDFVALFDQDYFVLATPESDAQINEMRNVMFHLINDFHSDYPTFPTDLGFTLIPDAPKAGYL